MPVVTYRDKELKGLRVPIITLAIRYGERWHPVEAKVCFDEDNFVVTFSPYSSVDD